MLFLRASAAFRAFFASSVSLASSAEPFLGGLAILFRLLSVAEQLEQIRLKQFLPAG